MKKLLLIIVILAVLAGGVALYLRATTPSQSRGVAFPLSAGDRELVSHVPASAEAFALVPNAAALNAKLRANAITRDVVDSWSAKQRMPEPWMIGGADLLAWRGGGKTQYYLRLDPVRAFLVRVYTMIAGGSDIVVINAPAEEAIAADELQRIETLAEKLPKGDAFVVQRESGRGAFPPISRPAVSSVAVDENAIHIVARAASSDPPSGPLAAQFPKGALLAAAFTTPPRLVDDLNRLLGGVKVGALLGGGGSLTLYDVESGKLMPRPIGVLGVPPSRRAEFQNFVDLARQGQALGYEVRTAERPDQLLISFDRSIDQYLKDTFEARQFPSARWAVRADPPRLAPILSQLSDNLGLRIASPRIFRGARDADRWISALGRASAIEAVDATDGTAEQLSVDIATK